MEWLFLALGFAAGVCATSIVVCVANDLGRRDAVR